MFTDISTITFGMPKSQSEIEAGELVENMVEWYVIDTFYMDIVVQYRLRRSESERWVLVLIVGSFDG